MFLVDTSAWIELFRRSSRLDLETVVSLEEIVICPPILQEVLQGFDDTRAYEIAREAMLAFPMVEAPVELAVFELAADLYRSARRRGVTVRSSVDCLIAVCALRNSLTVIHCDRDYDALARVTSLKVRRIKGD